MKNILLLLTLICFTSFAQNPDYHRYGARTKFVQPDTLSTAQRTSLTPKLGTLIYHKDTGVSQWEQWDGDSWEELGGGAVDSVQGLTGNVVITPDDLDDFSTLNKFVTEEEKDLIFTALQDAPSDGNEYVRKDGDWEVATGGGDNIYTADGTLEGDRSINIGEHSLSVKDSLGMPLLMLSNALSALNTSSGGKYKAITTSGIDGDANAVGFQNADPISSKIGLIKITNTDSTSIVMKSERFIFDIEGTTPDTGDVLTLQPDGTAKFQAPSGGGGGTDDQTASEVPFTPYSTIAAINVQDAIEEVLDEIPTSLAAANITVSPAIGGNTDTYAVMDDHEDRINDLESDKQDILSEGAFVDGDKTKLNGIATNATANSSDATLLNRANHTGTQTASTISDFDTEVSNNTAVAANTAKVGVTNEPKSDPTGVTGADAITNIISLTQAEYDAIGSPSATTLYIIKN